MIAKSNRKYIFGSFVIAFLFGLILYLGTPTEYKVEVKLLPEAANRDSNDLLRQLGGGAGALMGGGLARSQNELIDPILYNEILASTPFLFNLLEDTYKHSEFGEMTLREFYDNHKKDDIFTLIKRYTIQLPSQFNRKPHGLSDEELRRVFEDEGILQSSDARAVGDLKDKFAISYKPNLGLVSFSVTFYDRSMAKQLAEKATQSIIEYLVEYKAGKAGQNLNFVQKRHDEAKALFFKSQEALATFRDANFNIQSSSYKIREERLVAEFNQATSLYNTLIQQLEMAKVKLQEETPVFSVIEPAIMPRAKFKPNGLLISAAAIFLAVILSFSIVYLREVVFGYQED
ncbi:MAG: hypothetical protein JJU34_07940 [Lunatimonas sp.]|uniref:GNVR domain-containing protein n=1 Tax=Lunatimonas sp. TaxID=2060141 RepID=UPI00263AEFD2|nr:GNVR domain-containing protein [Lunatimonas sp.]MCC5937198.1 hypothetical protein [Lunatimonas sp.]